MDSVLQVAIAGLADQRRALGRGSGSARSDKDRSRDEERERPRLEQCFLEAAQKLRRGRASAGTRLFPSGWAFVPAQVSPPRRRY